MTDRPPADRLSGDEIQALKFAAHRQRARWSNKRDPGRKKPMPDGWRKIERGLFESADGQWRIANPWKVTVELRHRWLVAERDSTGSGWCMHDGDHPTLHEARAYVEARR